MFVVMGYFSFSSTNALPSVLVERDVFYRQRDAKYYKPLPYLIANILADVPMTVIEGVLFSCIVYWLCGLNDSEAGGRFGYFMFMCIAFYFVRFLLFFLTPTAHLHRTDTELSTDVPSVLESGGVVVSRSGVGTGHRPCAARALPSHLRLHDHPRTCATPYSFLYQVLLTNTTC
jgi:hypothetical protein